MQIILCMCSCTATKLYQYSWQWQYLLIVLCQCEYFSWNGEHLDWCKCSIRNCSISLQLLSSHTCRHLAVFISDADRFSAPTLPLHVAAFPCSCFAPSWEAAVGRSQGREVWVLPILLEHTCTCCLWVCLLKGKVMKSRCYQFYKGCSILICNCWSLCKLIIICIAVLNPARFLLKMSFFSASKVSQIFHLSLVASWLY